jgi:hypothetical protein
VCNATETMLRSGRDRNEAGDGPDGPLTPVPRASGSPEFWSERVELGLVQVGRRLDAVMSTLAPYRNRDDPLKAAYVEAHQALGDLAATYTWITLARRQAPPARRGRLRRPWGG